MADDFEIIIGTYEQFLLGYKVHNVENKYNLERSFATHSHLASLRTVASNRHYLASGGADDSVFLYDMRYRIESGRLTHHTDTVNCVTFTPDGSHIMTASSDGSIGIVRCGNWQLEKHWKSPHKGNSVNALAIHPTGKLSMSAGSDGVLRTWNLVKGRQAYATNLVPRLKLEAKNVTIIRWSPNGDKYLIVWNTKIDVYSVETAGLCAELNFESRVICVEFVSNDSIAIGHEDGKIRFYDIANSSSSLETLAHDSRVKCLTHRNNLLASASSTGEIKLWRCGKKKLNILTSANCGARITCITISEPCVDLTTKKEETKISDNIEARRKNIFRIRQEVIVVDEAEDARKYGDKSGKKSVGKKRKPEVLEEIEKTFAKKKKRKTEIVTNDTDMKKIKKRNLSAEKIVVKPVKKIKTESGKIADEARIIENNKSIDEIASTKKKKKRKKMKTTDNIEKPSSPAMTKRKHENSIPNAINGFSGKTKKKKIAR